MRIKVPNKPIKMPYNCDFLRTKPNTVAPKIKVLKGVKEFKMATIELSIVVIANANKKPGIKVPNKDV